MASRPYSARFMSGRGAGRSETFTVPEGKRAVVRHVAFVFWTGVGESGFVFVHGIPVYYLLAQGAAHFSFAEVRFTAYERETVTAATAGADVSYAIDGFLFADDVGEPDDADNIIGIFELGGTLPASDAVVG